MANAAQFQTLPSQPGMPGPHTGPNTPAHQRHMSQTMNVSSCCFHFYRIIFTFWAQCFQPRRSMANTGPGAMSNQYSQAVYDQPNCDYDPIRQNFHNQNFGNPYDCPEGMYGGSMMSSVGYSQVFGFFWLPCSFGKNYFLSDT